MSQETGSKLIRTILFGVLSIALYWALFHYSDALQHFAHTTPTACAVGHGPDTLYFLKPTAEACAGKGGLFVEGHWMYAFVPILVAFAMSYVHGGFTGLFWDAMGLNAKK